MLRGELKAGKANLWYVTNKGPAPWGLTSWLITIYDDHSDSIEIEVHSEKPPILRLESTTCKECGREKGN